MEGDWNAKASWLSDTVGALVPDFIKKRKEQPSVTDVGVQETGLAKQAENGILKRKKQQEDLLNQMGG